MDQRQSYGGGCSHSQYYGIIAVPSPASCLAILRLWAHMLVCLHESRIVLALSLLSDIRAISDEDISNRTPHNYHLRIRYIR